MENKYLININLLEEETLLISRRRNFFLRWLMVIVIIIIAGAAVNIYLINQTQKALNFNQMIATQIMESQPENADPPGSASFTDLFRQKGTQVTIITEQNMSKVKILEDLEQVLP